MANGKIRFGKMVLDVASFYSGQINIMYDR